MLWVFWLAYEVAETNSRYVMDYIFGSTLALRILLI
jgi:hypothetical protein